MLSTVLNALAHGYLLIVPVEACGNSSKRTEAAVIRQMKAAGAITTAVVSIGTKLSPDFSTLRGKEMFAIVQGIKVDLSLLSFDQNAESNCTAFAGLAQ